MTMLPVLRDEYSSPFYAAAEAGRLLLRQCATCGRWSEPAAQRCTYCLSADIGWAEASGRGLVVSWSVPHRRDTSGAMVPSYVIAIVELDEGPWLSAQVGLADRDLLAVGVRVQVGFVRVDGGEPLPAATVSPDDHPMTPSDEERTP